MKDNSNPASYKGLTPDEFMKKWLILGPISIFKDDKDQGEDLQKKAFAEDFLSQYGGETGIKPSADMACKIGDKDLQWKMVNSVDDTIDLIKIFGQKDYAIAYAYADIDMPSARKAFLGVGSNDAIKIWLNGKLVHENWIPRGVNKDDDFVPIDLQKGVNHLLLKIQNIQMGWGFICRELGNISIANKLTELISMGDIVPIEKLLSNGIDINLRNKTGLTALHTANMIRRQDIAEFLLDHGADPNIPMPSQEAIMDSILKEATTGVAPAVTVLVSRDGKILYHKAFGYANIEDEIPATVDTKFLIGSITKPFIASAILLKLQEEGKISINDKLSKFIPDFPRGDEVTIYQLLTHTSGIHSFTSDPEFYKVVKTKAKPEEMIETIKKLGYDFNPGEKWFYNNSGYYILGYIIEKIAGQTYGEYLKNQIFDQLGMKNTGDYNSEIKLENEAIGYSYEQNKINKAPKWDMSRVGGAGALYSTVHDLYLWNEGVFNGKVLSESSLKSAFTPATLKNGSVASAFGLKYGFGWFLNEFNGLKQIIHSGGLFGFNSYLIRYPDQKVTIIALTNNYPPYSANKDALPLVAGLVAQNAAYIYLWKEMNPTNIPTESKAVNTSLYDGYVGR
ncbi:MAG: serine hydrolase, partial [Candidatus Poribacteria bacterium]